MIDISEVSKTLIVGPLLLGHDINKYLQNKQNSVS